MTMQERNQYQMKLAACYARLHGVDLMTALVTIATVFAKRYPSSQVVRG